VRLAWKEAKVAARRQVKTTMTMAWSKVQVVVMETHGL
jgi:hypothetical protein